MTDVKATIKSPNVRFYCVDCNLDTGGGENWPGSVCYPRFSKYDDVTDFFEHNAEAAKYYKNVKLSDIDFYECDYVYAVDSYNVDDLVCVDVDNDVWMHRDKVIM